MPPLRTLLHFDVLADAEAADAHAPHERLMTGESHHVDVHLFHVDGNDAGGLGSIHDKRHAAFVADPADLPDRLHCAEHVRAVIDDHHPGVRPYGSGNVIGIDKSGAVERNKGCFGSVVADHVIDRPDHGVMFEVSGDDVIAVRKPVPG